MQGIEHTAPAGVVLTPQVFTELYAKSKHTAVAPRHLEWNQPVAYRPAFRQGEFAQRIKVPIVIENR